MTVKINNNSCKDAKHLFSEDALNFVEHLHKKFNTRRLELLFLRKKRQKEFDKGILPAFPKDTQNIRKSNWSVASSPKDLCNRRVEITGPAEAKMMINGLNSGANVFMADLEDSLSPTWDNIVAGHRNLYEACRKTLSFTKDDVKHYHLNNVIATLIVRPRGWHLDEKHVLVNGVPVSASIFDFGMYFFHNAQVNLDNGSGPYFYLPKLESHLEAKLWNEIFVEAQDYLKIPQGTIRATVLIETILAALEMEEILYELKDHVSGLNAGRWDYIFSVIKNFKHNKDFLLPDRSDVTMKSPFMQAYAINLVHVCHKRGAHAIGGMSAFIPNKNDALVTKHAIEKIRLDKLREAKIGYDGTWVAHPALVPIAREVFDHVVGNKPHQIKDAIDFPKIESKDLLNIKTTRGNITENGVRSNVNITLQYIHHWLSGKGAVAIHNLMEDMATAEISRAQLWQWIQNQVILKDGRIFDINLYRTLRDEEINTLQIENFDLNPQAIEILDRLVLNREFEDFLSYTAYAKVA